MARSRSKSAIIDADFQRWIRNPSDPVTHAVALSVQQVIQLGRRTCLGHNAGWVYAARNAHFGDSVLKIGQTRLSPLERVDQLSNSTAIYKPLELVYFVHTAERKDAEAMVHAALQPYRITPRREFFDVRALLAATAMVEVAKNLAPNARARLSRPAVPHQPVTCPACFYTHTDDLPTLLIPYHLSCEQCSSAIPLGIPQAAEQPEGPRGSIGANHTW